MTDHATDKHQLIQNLYKIGAIKIGEFTLKSGQHSTVYVDLRRIISYPDVLRAVANRIWESLRHAQFDLICGIPYTALPIATCISLQHNIPMIMRRKEKKEYGTKQMIEGVYKPGQSCVLIEDIITTGGSVLETARDMDEAGLVVKDVAVLIDREQGGRQNLERQYRVHAALTLPEILRSLLKSGVLTDTEVTLINQFLETKTQ
jgi:uridine monophosphate synthetase